MSKIPIGRLLSELPERRALIKEKSKQSIPKESKPEVKFSRASLSEDKKSELIKTLSDTQGKVILLLEKLDKWPLETQWKSSNNGRSLKYNIFDKPKHSIYRAGAIRDIKNQIVAGYTAVREILDKGSCISYSEDLSLFGEIDTFNEKYSTTLTSTELKDFQKRVFNILKAPLKDIGVIG